MDPDTCLAEMRELAKDILEDETDHEAAICLAERFEALDGWLSRKGYLPVAWKR